MDLYIQYAFIFYFSVALAICFMDATICLVVRKRFKFVSSAAFSMLWVYIIPRTIVHAIKVSKEQS